ncbi:MAG TPA: MotA/TolQ/ExbB proton channel family protein [Verrucomicrobiae bacterium]|nr:MotA/TolQ/ExbB proton channel family protein [Verrucomicrobiae bacterium]
MIGLMIHPLFAENAATYAIKNATTEGKVTVVVLLLLSLFSWTVILTKLRQILIARKATKKFMAAYASTRDPLDILKKGENYDGAPAYQLYIRGADELTYQLKNNPVQVKAVVFKPGGEHTNTDILAKSTQTKMSPASFEALKVVLEEAAGEQAMELEKGMIILSTAVAGGPFIGLLGTVWGVMSTFAGIAESHSASLTTMAPGVAAALVATVTGLLVAIPAMFAYNMMVTTIRFITQELDGFASRYANQIEHVYVAHRPLAEELREANEALAGRIVGAMKMGEESAQMDGPSGHGLNPALA